MEEQKDNSTEGQLKRFRQGYKQKLMFKAGALDVYCRILPAIEQAKIISNAKLSVRISEHHDNDIFESISANIAILFAGCTVDGIPYLGKKFLEELSGPELTRLYDLYDSEIKFVNSEFESLSTEDINELIDSVKKKKTSSKDYFMWQLAEIGRYCLDHLVQKDSARG